MKKVVFFVVWIVISASVKGMIGASVRDIINYRNNLRLITMKDENGNTPLMIAAISDWEGRLQYLLRIKAKVDEKNNDGDTALSLALQYGSTSMAKILLENNADPNLENNKKQTPLMFASYQGYYEIVDHLIKSGADVNAEDEDTTTSLMLASEKNNEEIVKCLIRHGANVNAKDKGDLTSLMFASYQGNEEIVKYLIRHGANVNAKDRDNMTSLMFASYQGYGSIVKILISNGAGIKIEDNQGKTAKHFALSNGHKKVVKILREEESKIIADYWKAVHLGDLQTVQRLVSRNKFLLNELDSFGNNSLLLALCYKEIDMSKWLLEKKVNLNIKNIDGDTPILAAIRYAFVEILKFPPNIPDVVYCPQNKEGTKSVLICRGVFEALIEERLEDVRILLDTFEIRDSLKKYLPSVYALLKIYYQAMINENFVEPAIRATLQIDPIKISYQVDKLLNPGLTVLKI